MRFGTVIKSIILNKMATSKFWNYWHLSCYGQFCLFLVLNWPIKNMKH